MAEQINNILVICNNSNEQTDDYLYEEIDDDTLLNFVVCIPNFINNSYVLKRLTKL
jgi:hypothetical protein